MWIQKLGQPLAQTRAGANIVLSMPLTHAHNIGHLYLIENQGHVVTGIVLIAASTWSYQNGISACSGAGGDEVRLSRKLYPLPSGFYQTIQVVGTHTTGFMTVLYVNNTMVRVARGTGVITIAPAAVVYHLNCSGTHSLLVVVTRAVSSMPVYTTVPVTPAPSEVKVVGYRPGGFG